MKNKDITNLREEVTDLEARLAQKTNEVKTARQQHQILQSRLEEAMSELD